MDDSTFFSLRGQAFGYKEIITSHLAVTLVSSESGLYDADIPLEVTPMKRLILLLILVLFGAVSILLARGWRVEARQAQQQPQPAALEIQKVKDTLYVISGGGGNTAVFLSEKGVVLVDTKLPGNGPGILDKVKSVTNKPVTMIINTHTHGDHVGSNDAFTGAVEFVAHENCKASMEKMPAFQSEAGKKFLPGKTYKDKLTLLSGKDKIELHHYGPGHTNGDTFVVFTGLGTMHSGDLFAMKGMPLIDTTNGGSALEYPRTLGKAAAGIKGVDTVIPGHSAVTDFKSFVEFSEFMRDVVAAASAAKKAGKSVDDATTTLNLPEKYKSYNMGRLKDDLTKLYAEVK